ncbi:MAG TPA: hypothetical protein VD772_07235, partial [Anseongella sp.]|nr:hypothetical protein [Anseongella sp.]
NYEEETSHLKTRPGRHCQYRQELTVSGMAERPRRVKKPGVLPHPRKVIIPIFDITLILSEGG